MYVQYIRMFSEFSVQCHAKMLREGKRRQNRMVYVFKNTRHLAWHLMGNAAKLLSGQKTSLISRFWCYPVFAFFVLCGTRMY